MHTKKNRVSFAFSHLSNPRVEVTFIAKSECEDSSFGASRDYCCVRTSSLQKVLRVKILRKKNFDAFENEVLEAYNCIKVKSCNSVT